MAPQHPCPYRESAECHRIFRSPGEAATHAKEVHEEPTVPCHYAAEFDCHELFGTEKQATAHGRRAHGKGRFPCPDAEKESCSRTFTTVDHARLHAESCHRKLQYPCPYREELACLGMFTSKGNAEAHAKTAHEQVRFPCLDPKCEQMFTNKRYVTEHVKRVHPTENPEPRQFPCPLAEDQNCLVRFHTRGEANLHVRVVHKIGKFPCPEAQTSGCPDAFSSMELAKRHVNSVHKGERYPCLVPDCQETYAKEAYLLEHMERAHPTKDVWPCPFAEKFGCLETFPTKTKAMYHAREQHTDKYICQYSNCLVHVQEKKMTARWMGIHQRIHLKRGHFKKGECPPMQVPVAPSASNVEVKNQPAPNPEDGGDEGEASECEAREAGNSGSESLGDEEAQKQGDHGCAPDKRDVHQRDLGTESNDDEALVSEDLDCATAAVAATWLDNKPSESQEKLRKLAVRVGQQNIGLKCIGPRSVDKGLVIGAEVCPNGATISLENGVLRERPKIVSVQFRCITCHSRYRFKQFIWNNFLNADDSQGVCAANICVKPLWEGTKFCRMHFLEWKPEDLALDQQSIVELKRLFSQAASEQWLPVSKIAKVMKKETSEQNALPLARLVNIDLEFSFTHSEVFQVGLADIDGKCVLDCLPKYSKPPAARSSSSPAPLSFHQRMFGKKFKIMPSIHGTLDSKGVLAKLDKNGITPKTTFVSWASWHFDLSLLREWLEIEGHYDMLPNNEDLWLLLMEFRGNLERILGRKCFKGRRFPLKLPFLFPLLFGDDHLLAGRNHNAFVDAQQLALLTNLFLDLCKPLEERVIWKGSEARDLGSSHKRQFKLDFFYDPSTSAKKRKLF